jgi:hypothetical protein
VGKDADRIVAAAVRALTQPFDTPHTKGMLDYSMEKLPTTIEDLAAMINTHMASKEDIKEVKEDVAALRTEMTAGFHHIEHLLLAQQKREIEDLKTRMKRLEDALAV